MLSKILLDSVLTTSALAGVALILSTTVVAAETQLTDSVGAMQLADDARLETNGAGLVRTRGQARSPDQITAGQAVTEQSPAQLAQASPEPVVSTTSLDQVAQYSSEGGNAQAQVTSITQLSDVQPTDWAYQALQSLVERYGCIAGYPDGTYKGQRAMTRFEFAAGMNACLDRISELIAASTADLATKEDLATLQRLQEEFATELAALRGRVDSLEARTSELEANQFSTTTKLSGETIFSVGVPIDGDDQYEDQTIAGYRVRLNFDTSFTGEDLLRARLQARDFANFSSFAGNTNWNWSFASGSDTVFLDDLLYIFPVGDVARVTIGANSIGDSDFVATTVSPFDNSGQGTLTNGLGTPPQYSFVRGGTGLGVILGITDNISLDLGYAAGGFSTSDTRSAGGIRSAGDPRPGYGLFNGDYGLIAQLSFLTDLVDAAFMYSNTYSRSGHGGAGFGNLGNYTGAFSDDGEPEIANIYGAQVNFKLGFAQIGGGAMYMPVRVLDGPQQGDYRVWSYQGTLAFPDLGGDGNMLGFVVGVPPRISGISTSLFGNLSGLSRDTRQDASLLAEVFYRFRLNDNISITPGLVYIQDPGNDNSKKDTFAGGIRTTFSF